MFLQFWNWISSKGLQGYALRAKTDKTGDETKEIMRANPSYLQIEPTPDKNIFFLENSKKQKLNLPHTSNYLHCIYNYSHSIYIILSIMSNVEML